METLVKAQENYLFNQKDAPVGIFHNLLTQKAEMVVVGLGYVGLPIALEFAKHFRVLGFDISRQRVSMMRNGIDPSNVLKTADFENRNIKFTSRLSEIKAAKFFVVAVPTPIDDNNAPDLRPLKEATRSVAEVLKKGDYVVFESTVYPGCTEEICVPILQGISGLKLNKDFKVGYSPERINPGDKVHTFTNVKKVVSGSDRPALRQITQVYNHVVDAGVHVANSIKVAEAAKVIENTQRDVNIALINELSVIFNGLDIDTYEVLEAAATNWNFLNFQPGLIGEHCVGVDPYYLIYKSKSAGIQPHIIESSRRRNESMARHLATSLCEQLIDRRKVPADCKVLVQGITLKEDISDVCNSKVVDLINEIIDLGYTVHVADPYADSKEVLDEHSITLTTSLDNDYDAVVVAVNHKQYMFYDETFYHAICTDDPVIMDLNRSAYGRVNGFKYMSM